MRFSCQFEMGENHIFIHCFTVHSNHFIIKKTCIKTTTWNCVCLFVLTELPAGTSWLSTGRRGYEETEVGLRHPHCRSRGSWEGRVGRIHGNLAFNCIPRTGRGEIIGLHAFLFDRFFFVCFFNLLPHPPPPQLHTVLSGLIPSSIGPIVFCLITPHGAMGRRIDPSCGQPIELFLVPASAPRLVYQRPWYVLSCLGWCI